MAAHHNRITGAGQCAPKRVQMYSMNRLSPKRSAILTFIRERIADHGQPPSLADIATAFGFASRSVARKHIQALAEAGFIEVTRNQARGIRLAGALRRPEVLEIPVLGQVLKVRGDSMLDDGILDGDLVGIKQQAEARDGQIIVARLDGEVTIKRFERVSARQYRLLPRNPAYAPIEVGPGQDFVIEGVFCGLVRRG
ncbi:LexA repressor [compost metagenome]